MFDDDANDVFEIEEPTSSGSHYYPLKEAVLLKEELDDVEDTSLLPSVIQFGCAIYYIVEGQEPAMKVDVVRLGDSRGTASVEYYTKDSSAKAGRKYLAVSGSLTFNPGESLKTIEVPVLDDTSFDATLEFGVYLKTVRGAQMGKYLHQCRVKIIDDDCFPTNKYAEEFQDNTRVHDIPGFSLMIEYIRMVVSNDDTLWATIKYILLDQVKGIYYFLTLYLQMYVIDVVLKPTPEDIDSTEGGEGLDVAHVARKLVSRLRGEEEEGEGEEFGFMLHSLLIPGDRAHTAMVVGALYMFPFFIVHITDSLKVRLALPMMLRKLLRMNLMRKFLNYKEEIRSIVNGGMLSMAMMRDVREVVDGGYIKILEIIRILGKLFLALLFILAENRMGAVPLLVCPIILGMFLRCRERLSTHCNHDMAASEDKFVQAVHEAVHLYPLIADFYMRPLVVDRFEMRIDDMSSKEVRASLVIQNNSYLAPYLTTFFIGCYIFVGAYQLDVLNNGGTLTLGAFLATINVFKELGREIQEIYIECMEVQKSFGPLKIISIYMNFPTDLKERMRINRMRRAVGGEMWAQARKDLGQSVDFAVDTVNFDINNLSFNYPGDSPTLKNVNITFEQGKAYAFMGPPHGGKATFLKLLGQSLLPGEDGGSIFAPPHLRILHISQNMIMPGSFLRNIVLNNNLEAVGGKERVKRICEQLSFDKFILDLLDTETDDHHHSHESQEWTVRLSHTAYPRISLARAFVMNPEVLVIHKPLVAFNEEEQRQIMSLLVKHAEQRGLELPELQRRFRRPRTVFFSASSKNYLDNVHKIYTVANAKVLEAVSLQL